MTPVQQAARRRAEGLVADETADVVRRRRTGGGVLPATALVRERTAG